MLYLAHALAALSSSISDFQDTHYFITRSRKAPLSNTICGQCGNLDCAAFSACFILRMRWRRFLHQSLILRILAVS